MNEKLYNRLSGYFNHDRQSFLGHYNRVIESLKLFEKPYRIEVDEKNIESWMIALAQVDLKYFDRAEELILKEPGREFLKVNAFFEACEKIKKNEIAASRVNENINSYSNISNDLAKRRYHDIIARSKKADDEPVKDKQLSRPALLLYEYRNLNGTIERIECNGHVDKEVFKNECARYYRVLPSRVEHAYQVFKTIKTTDNRGNFAGAYQTYVDCSHTQKGAEPVTVAKFWG